MDLKIIGTTKDLRTNTDVVYGQVSINDYLILVGENYDQYSIQRRKETHRAYSRMKLDIKAGALLPPITLAVNKSSVTEIKEVLLTNDLNNLQSKLGVPGIFSILDGLQRTYVLNEIKKENFEFKAEQKLLIEFWIEPEPKHLIYRLIILNAGQKPMSLRHQIELLFNSLAERLKESIENLEIFKETENKKRSKPAQYPFERLVTSYQSYLWKTPELNRNNLVAQQMMEDSVLDSEEEKINETFEKFVYYLRKYTELDINAFNKYSADVNKSNWLSLENVMTSFFAAITDFGTSTERLQRIDSSLKKLNDALTGGYIEDPLGLESYFSLIQGIASRKINVGVATRRLLFSAFKEFFREEGEKKLSDCWKSEA
ncbi:hypothetical protein OQX63_20590 [Pedobacter sp. PF22-3]|uniref:hypothetical protein n=1 Tax=Pedobacter sp. PF22-3 TaxID=2994467 RepID=UPI0022470D01|nr:hypothetical protein [Pedobacter sp. PF22-3]MCX2495905.1 hypothetical protein [Pedobacter sp. PF22-3]